MKKLIFGIALLFVGAAGVIALLACTLLAEPVVYNGTSGWLGCLQSMGLTPARKKFNKNVAATDEEVECMKRIISKGSSIYYQLVPSDMALNIEKLF